MAGDNGKCNQWHETVESVASGRRMLKVWPVAGEC